MNKPIEHKVKTFLSAVVTELLYKKVPICRLGYFGSVVQNPCSKDIDILLTLSLPHEDRSDFEEVLRVVIKRMEGDYSQPAPINKAAFPYVETCVEVLNKISGLPVVYGLGPSNKHNFKDQWIHLNGPIEDEVWSLFTNRFPIHGLVIRENYVPVYGDPPECPKIDGYSLLKYCSDVKIRDSKMPTLKAIDKLIKILAILGGNSYQPTLAAIDKVFSWLPLIKSELINFFETARDNEASPLTHALVDILSGIAKIMIVRSLQYPRDWQVK